MNNWLASWKRFAAIAVVPVITSVVLLIVSASEEFSERSVAASLLILGFAVFGVSGMLFTGRAIWKWLSGRPPPICAGSGASSSRQFWQRRWG